MRVVWRLSAAESRDVEHALVLAAETAVPAERWRFRALLARLGRHAVVGRTTRRRRMALLSGGR